MNKQKLTEFTDDILIAAKNNITKDGYLSPVALLLTETGLLPVILSSDNHSDEREMMLALKEKIAEVEAGAVVIVREAWTLEREASAMIDLSTVCPSSDPERGEAIILYASTPIDTFCIYQSFFRDATTGKINFGEKHSGAPEMLSIPEGFWNTNHCQLH